jgi:hypothetical protein
MVLSMTKQNTDFRLGLNRQQLVDAAQLFGKSDRSAKKSNTKRLEQFVTTKLAGKGTKVPSFTEQQKRDIHDSAKSFGVTDALHMVSYRIGKVTGNQDETNYMRLTIGRAFQAYYDKGVTSANIDELMSRIPMSNRNEIVSGVSRHEPYYQNLFIDYANELEEQAQEKS